MVAGEDSKYRMRFGKEEVGVDPQQCIRLSPIGTNSMVFSDCEDKSTEIFLEEYGEEIPEISSLRAIF